LHDQFYASVPIFIAHSAELHCFLMKDAGRLLREILDVYYLHCVDPKTPIEDSILAALAVRQLA
jgi:aryl-alcohol dehydrogenase-like predicted oxidoreductase